MKFLILITFTLIIGGPATFAKSGMTNVMSIGQGVSSPNMHANINLSSGFTLQNPVGAYYQQGARFSAQYIDGDIVNGSGGDSYNAIGLELGYGGGSWGVTASAYDYDDENDATDDDEDLSAGLYFGMKPLDSLGFGIGFLEDHTILGFIFNPDGMHRIGLSYSVDTSSSIISDVNTIALGYSYVENSFTLTADASKRTWAEATNGQDDPLFLTLGFMFRADMFQFVINHEMVQSDDGDSIASEETWYGVGFGKESWHVGIYSEYNGELAVNASFMF
ncbi:MAG: hypothetical protein R2827_07665 [Bdellovibrionales bacterium]